MQDNKIRDSVYVQVLKKLDKAGWVRGCSHPHSLLITLETSIRALNLHEEVADKVYNDFRSRIIENYESRICIKARAISDFGSHKDTTYEEIVALLSFYTSQPTVGQIKFREWF